MLLERSERARLKGFIVNKFRGDPSLFDGGVAEIVARTGMAWLGTLPHLDCVSRLPPEDAMALGRLDTRSDRARPIRVAVPRLSRAANLDDLDALRIEPDVALEIVPPGRALPGDADLVVLLGTKSTLADLAFLRAQGWDIDLHAHRRRGGHVLGLCGGYQMLGRSIADPEGADGAPGRTDGLGLLDVETVMAADKTVREARATDVETGAAVSGYEIHLGRTAGPDCARPMLAMADRRDGAVSADGRVMGCYLHGLLAADGFRHALLARLRPQRAPGPAFEREVDAALDALAAAVEAHLDLDRIWEIANGR
jgi:adenosylcobyric acid synthase